MAKPAQVFCPVCGAEYIWETERSWWLFWDRCYSCPGQKRINDVAFPWDVDTGGSDAVAANQLEMPL